MNVKEAETQLVQGLSAVQTTANQDVQHMMSYLKVVHAGWILALVLLLAGGGFLIHRQLVSYDNALGKANDANQALVADLKDTASKWSQGQQQIAASQSRTIVIEKTVAANDTATAAKVEEVTKPDATTAQVQGYAGSYLGEVPTVTPDLKLAFKPPTVQGFIANKIELGNANTKLGLKTEELGEANKQAGIYSDNLKTTQATLEQCTKTVKDYKVVAVKSKWRKIGGTMLDYGIKVGIAYGSFKLGQATK